MGIPEELAWKLSSVERWGGSEAITKKMEYATDNTE